MPRKLKGGDFETFLPGTNYYSEASLAIFAGGVENWARCQQYIGGSLNAWYNSFAEENFNNLVKDKSNKATFASVKDKDEPTRNEYIDMCSASYKKGDAVPKKIGEYNLVFNEETIKIYSRVEGNKIFDVIAVRGSVSLEDWRTNLALLPRNAIPSGDRYKRDKASLDKFYKQLDPEDKATRTFGCGHSLGGALLDRYIDEGYVEKGLSINPAFEPRNTHKKMPNFRIYNRRDALFNTFGWMLLLFNPDKPVVVGSVSGWDYIPIIGYLFGHTDKEALKGMGALKDAEKTPKAKGCGKAALGHPPKGGGGDFDFECYW